MTNAKPTRRGVPQPLHGGPQRFGPYLLEARLAVGTTTEVYLARLAPDASAGRPDFPERFVVKRMLPHLVVESDARSRFEREAVLHAAVSHPNVVKVWEAGTTVQGEPYLALEYVDGCDAFRLLRRTSHDRLTLPVTMSVRIATEALLGLSAIHAARDSTGSRLDIVHRDVTPSNLYLSRSGDVKVGDFGIARSLQRLDASITGEVVAQDASLLGKFSYLAPEQVAGEPFDHRADLFSLATVLAELLIGKPLFPGTGQLQVLLAIRDCNLAPLREVKGRLPEGLLTVIERGLAREPELRFPDASTFYAALSPFAGGPTDVRRELGLRVTSVQMVPSDAHVAAVRENSRATRPSIEVDPAIPVTAVAPARESDHSHPALELDLEVAFSDELDPHDRDTGMYPELQSYVHKQSGERTGPWTFARLVEGIATGVIRGTDRVDYLGLGPKVVDDIPDLARLLPKGTVPPAPPPLHTPAYMADLGETTMLDVLAHVLAGRQSGLMLLERPGPPNGAEEDVQQRELYFLRGRLHHVVSSHSGERLGESLVRRGKLSREELDLALAVLPKYGGRMGETLIALGLVDSVDIFRAIREQGRDRVTELFLWQEGSAEFHPEAAIPAVEFPLDTDLPTLMISGLEASHPGDTPMAFIEPQLDSAVVPNPRPDFAGLVWPPVVAAALQALARPLTLRELLGTVTRASQVSGADVARALELLLAVDLARWA